MKRIGPLCSHREAVPNFREHANKGGHIHVHCVLDGLRPQIGGDFVRRLAEDDGLKSANSDAIYRGTASEKCWPFLVSGGEGNQVTRLKVAG